MITVSGETHYSFNCHLRHQGSVIKSTVGKIANFFSFEYITQDERLQPENKTILLETKKVTIKGVLTKVAYDPVANGFFSMTGFFLEADGIEYGSITTTPDNVYNILTTCGCKDRIHVLQFGIQFK